MEKLDSPVQCTLFIYYIASFLKHHALASRKFVFSPLFHKKQIFLINSWFLSLFLYPFWSLASYISHTVLREKKYAHFKFVCLAEIYNFGKDARILYQAILAIFELEQWAKSKWCTVPLSIGSIFIIILLYFCIRNRTCAHKHTRARTHTKGKNKTQK